ncbi:MAG: DUF1080 domain-containing protein [Burkholderiales bacterium]|nr:DUF1080 domain-containing protein [Burkholderiales bacterium]
MKRLWITIMLLATALVVAGCAHSPQSGWITLIDGDKGIENFNAIGDAKWRAEGGAIVADKGKGSSHLVTKNAYKDFEIYAEFWADTTTNSGIFIRAADPKKVGADSSYEVNIFDQRPGQEYATGAIVGFAQVPVPIIHKAGDGKGGGKWNTFEIRAKGPEITVVFNGVVTVHLQNSKYASGPFALQFANGAKNAPGGPIKWRKVMVRPL